MIEIQLQIDGPWIPLMTGIESGSTDRIGESRRVLAAGLTGIRLCYAPGIRVDTEAVSHYAWQAWRYGSDRQFAWQSGSMSGPAFASLEEEA